MQVAELRKGQTISGLVPNKNVTVINIEMYSDDQGELTYRLPDGTPDSIIIESKDLDNCIVLTANSAMPFTCHGDIFKLVTEAERIKLAYLFDPYTAVNTSAIDPLPHQITAVYEQMLNKHPLRYVLADDPGAGKTIMTGLLLKELIIRGDVKRALIVAPGNLVENWQDELLSKFSLSFEILTNEAIESAASGNVFLEHNFLIARLDKLSRNDEVKSKLEASDWDIIIADEAHKLSASMFGGKVYKTKRYQLGELLSRKTRHFLLLTATPHNGKEDSFKMFMSLVDPDRFSLYSDYTPDTSDIMRRLVKEDLLKFDGTPLFPERVATTVSYTLSDDELDLYDDVTKYVKEQFNKAESLKNDRKIAVGFALTTLQRRLASSPEAICRSLQRRLEKLQKTYDDLGKQIRLSESGYSVMTSEDDIDDYEDLTEEEQDAIDNTLDGATAAATKEELEKEIQTLKQLVLQAESIRRSNTDKKWDELSKLLQSPEMINADGTRSKIIIFTEHKDTLQYLEKKIKNLIGKPETVITISGGMSRNARRTAESLFRQDKEVSILIATDAAGEGINLQRAHFMINYDLPWNPNRIEQRFGRIHRIGQTEICHLWNLVAKDTREGEVFQKLFEKLEQERDNLGGKVFDVLGKLKFEDKPLRDILIEAIRYGEDPIHKNKINTVVDSAMDTESLRRLIEQHSLTNDFLDVGIVRKVKEDMERMKARKLQPYYIESFFKEAFADFDGYLEEKEPGRFEIRRVPSLLSGRINNNGYGVQILNRYERICFEKEKIHLDGKPDADLVVPGHPLLDGLIEAIESRHSDEVSKGTIFIDPMNKTDKPRILCAVDTKLRDDLDHNGIQNIIARQLSFVEIESDKKAHNAGFAPYLDYQNISGVTYLKAKEVLNKNSWALYDCKTIATAYAATSILPKMKDFVVKERNKTLDRIQHEVNTTLSNEMNYWYGKSGEYLEKSRLDKTKESIYRTKSKEAEDRAEMLDNRLTDRMNEIEQSRHVVSLPPSLSNIAFIIPAMMLENGNPEQIQSSYEAKKEIEKKAMDAVMAVERKLGFKPKDVSSENRGYDIESSIPESRQKEFGYAFRAIEVKGRSVNADNTVTLSINEIRTELNLKDQFILAFVSVDNDKTTTTYCKNVIKKLPEGTEAGINYYTDKLLAAGQIIYDERSQNG